MPLNRNTLIRLRTIDTCLCRRQRLWTIEDLRQACEDALAEYEGIDSVSLRTVQRDIELMRSDKLGYNAPIVVKQRKYYMYEDPGYSITQMPLNAHDLAELGSAIDIIRQYNGFKSLAGSEDILTRLQDRIQQQENHRQVIFIETNPQLKGLHFLDRLYGHIVRKEAIRIRYQSFKSRKPGTFHLSPYYLKEFNNRWFLIAYNPHKQDIQTVALDRLTEVEKDEEMAYVENTFFDPETYFGEMVGITRDVDTRPVTVTIRVDADQAPYVLTKPLHASQQPVRREEDGSVVLSLQVIHNMELERLLLGFGEHLEVIAPRELRQRMAQKVLVAATKYQRQPH